VHFHENSRATYNSIAGRLRHGATFCPPVFVVTDITDCHSLINCSFAKQCKQITSTAPTRQQKEQNVNHIWCYASTVLTQSGLLQTNCKSHNQVYHSVINVHIIGQLSSSELKTGYTN